MYHKVQLVNITWIDRWSHLPECTKWRDRVSRETTHCRFLVVEWFLKLIFHLLCFCFFGRGENIQEQTKQINKNTPGNFHVSFISVDAEGEGSETFKFKVMYNINNQGSKECGAAVPLSVYTKERHKPTSWECPKQIVRFFLEKEIIFTEYDKKCVHTSQKTFICMISSFRHPDINIKVTILVLMVTISLYNYKRC